MGQAAQDVARHAQHVRLEQEIAVEHELAEALDPDVEVGRGLVADRQQAQGRGPRHQDRAGDEQHALDPDRRQDQRQRHRLGSGPEAEQRQQTEADRRKCHSRQQIQNGPCREKPQPKEQAGGGGRGDPVMGLDDEPAHQVMCQPAEQQHGGELADHLVPIITCTRLGLGDQPSPHVRHVDHCQRDARDRGGKNMHARAEFRSEVDAERLQLGLPGRLGGFAARDQRLELRDEPLPCGGVLERGHQPLQLFGIDRRSRRGLLHERRLLRLRPLACPAIPSSTRASAMGAQARRQGAAVGLPSCSARAQRVISARSPNDPPAPSPSSLTPIAHWSSGRLYKGRRARTEMLCLPLVNEAPLAGSVRGARGDPGGLIARRVRLPGGVVGALPKAAPVQVEGVRGGR